MLPISAPPPSAPIPGLGVYNAVINEMAPPSRRPLPPPARERGAAFGRPELVSSNAATSLGRESSGPVSGVVGRTLFRGDAGAGYILNSDADVVAVEFEGIDAGLCQVVRLSPEAIWFSAEAPRALRHNHPVRVRVRWSDGVIESLLGEIVQLNPHLERAYHGVRLTRVPLAAGREMLRMLGVLVARGAAQAPCGDASALEEVTEPERLHMITRVLATVGREGALRRKGKPARVKIASVDTTAGHITWTSSVPMSEWGEAPYSVDVIGYNSVYRLELDSATEQDGKVLTPLPAKARRVRHRWYRREAVETNITVRYHHPIWREIKQVRSVSDISFGGLCFSADLEEDLVFPGLVIPVLTLETTHGEPIYLKGEVRTVVPPRGDEPGRCGLHVTPCSPEDELLWVRLVSETLHRHTKTSEQLLEPLWDLFQDSGYFNLAGRTTDYFTDLKRKFIDLGKRAADAPQLICQVVWPSDRGVEATGSFLKAYQHAWMGHQLAKRPGRPSDDSGQVLRDVYLRMFEHSQIDPDLRWIIGYIEPHVPWMKKAHLEFARRHERSGEALVMTMRMLNAFVSDMSPTPIGEFEVGRATLAEKELICSVVQERRPFTYVDSLDFTVETIDCGGVSRQWGQSGMEREREIHVARLHGEPVCAAVFEIGQAGSNMFRLLDSARVIPLTAEGRTRLAYLRMVDEGRRWFARRGRDMYLYLREDDDWSYAEAAKLHDVSDARFWCISSKLIPEFLENVYELTGRRANGKP